MRPRVGQGQAKGVSCPAARPADALQVVGRCGRHRAEHGRRQIPDVDAKLQGGSADEEVGSVGSLARLEALLDALPLGAGQEPRVLLGEYALQASGAIDPPIVGLFISRNGNELPRAAELKTDLSRPLLDLARGDDDRPAALPAGHLPHVARGAEAGRCQSPGAASLSGELVGHQKTGVLQAVDGLAVELIDALVVPVDAESASRPVPVPSLAPRGADERVVHGVARAAVQGPVGQKARQNALSPEGRQEGLLALGKFVPVAFLDVACE